MRITHPFHPLYGREYEYFRERRAWGEERVYVKDEHGVVHSLPCAWTSAAAADPFVVIAAGRCRVRVVDLLAMVDLLKTRTP